MLYRDKIRITDGYGRVTEGVVYGKVKGCDAYVINSMEYNSSFLIKFAGLPNRNVELEWGHFTGRSAEVIVTGDKLEKK